MTGKASIGVAVVGAGHWGPHLVRNFDQHPASILRYIVEIDRGRWPSLSERFDGLELTDNWGLVLADPAVHAVVIATPTTTHFELAEAALRAGKHVLVEKPLTDSSATADRLVSLAEENQLVLMVGHVFLFNQGVRDVKDLIDIGALGAIRYVSMNRTNLGPVRLDVSAAWDLAAHDISIASYWLKREPQYVSANGGSWLNPGICDAVFITARYPEDTLVHVEASWLNPRKNRLISVVGEQKMVTLDDVDVAEPIRIYDKGVVLGGGIADTFAGFRSQIREGEVTIPHVALGEPLRAECNAFVQRVLGEADTISDGRGGADVVRVLEAIDVSMKQNGAEVAVRHRS